MSVIFSGLNMFANAIDEQDEGIAITPITDYIAKHTMLEGTSQYPIEDVLLKGETANRTLPWNVKPDKLAITSTGTLQFDSMSENLANTTGLLFFVSIPNANTINLTLIFKKFANSRHYGYPEVSLKVGANYQKMSLNSNEWESGEIINCYNDDQPNTNKTKGGFQFDGAFTGYVKIPYASMKSIGIKYIDCMC